MQRRKLYSLLEGNFQFWVSIETQKRSLTYSEPSESLQTDRCKRNLRLEICINLMSHWKYHGYCSLCILLGITNFLKNKTHSYTSACLVRSCNNGGGRKSWLNGIALPVSPVLWLTMYKDRTCNPLVGCHSPKPLSYKPNRLRLLRRLILLQYLEGPSSMQKCYSTTTAKLIVQCHFDHDFPISSHTSKLICQTVFGCNI